jgi:hypothetical protein
MRRNDRDTGLAWSRDKSHHEFAWAKRAASKRLREVNFASYKFATFFTKGLPYGLFIGNIIPCSHVMKELDCGLFITNALVKEHVPLGLASAIVFSPELFASEETEDISKLLDVPSILPPVDGFLLLDRAKFPASFAGDVSPEEAEFMADSQVPWGVNALGGTIGEAAWKARPSWYLLTTEDRMLPPDAQRADVEARRCNGRAG